MRLLVFNCGSSSLTFKILETDGKIYNVFLYGKAHRVGVKGIEESFIEISYKDKCEKIVTSLRNHKESAEIVIDFLIKNSIKPDGIGHRFVHGGDYFKGNTLIDEKNIDTLRKCLPLAPIHNSISLSVIEVCRRKYPDVREFVVFDNFFHKTIPEIHSRYLLPKNLIEKFGFKKYGFHGLSYYYVTKKIYEILNLDIEKDELKVVACHLGTGGSSVCAIKNGKSIDTSMGYSPNSGLMMSTRTGDIDPMLLFYIMYLYRINVEELIDLINKKSGILGISGFSSDLRDVINAILKEKKENAKLAFEMYTYRLKKYVSSYIFLLKGIDVLIFTDDIGVKNPLVREKICENMDWAGIVIDKEKNKNINEKEINFIHKEESKVKIAVIPTDEEIVIAWEGYKLIKEIIK
ncbi:MAG TPA: acetate/propionate family kinase [bacterium]|nr:acetate/propionate family kinase [bacterium]HOM27139.1 acetate/propionate family kinase [bacterium]